MPGEMSKDEIFLSTRDDFRRDVCYKVLDAVINSVESRFIDSREVMKMFIFFQTSCIVQMKQ